jgi:ATP dependent DNA ligase domain
MARTSTLPKRLQPMLATLTDAPFDDKGWIFEDKYDGFRMVAKIEDGSVILYSRNGKIISHNYIEVAKALEGVKGDVLGRRFFVALHLPEAPRRRGNMAKGRPTPRSLLRAGVCQLSQKLGLCFRIKTSCSNAPIETKRDLVRISGQGEV